jgi:hypothetical protein
MLHVSLVAIALFLGVIAFRDYVHPQQTALAFDTKFDYVTIVSPVFLYKGTQGVLLLDKRNGNIWFISKGDQINPSFKDPVYITRLPLEKLDQAPQ